MRNIAFILISFLALNSFGQQYSKKWADVNYANDDKSYHLLDIYLPKIEKESYPVVVYIYGSAWYSNNAKGADISTVGNALLNAGYAVVMPNHRASSDSLFPAQIHDIKAVIRFVRAECKNYKLDTTFIGISGSSSGGHLASMAGTTSNIKQYTVDTVTIDLEGALGKYTSYSSSVYAVCNWFGPAYLLNMDSCRKTPAFGGEKSPEESLIGGTLADNKTQLLLASPVAYVDSACPPFIIFQGDADPLVTYCQSEQFFNALQAKGVDSQYILMPGGQHYTGVHTQANFDKMVKFFNRISNNQIETHSLLPEKEIFKIFPNPANDILYVQSNTNVTALQYHIQDISGKNIMGSHLNGSNINIAQLDRGIYFLKLQLTNGQEYTYKIVKA